MSNDPAPPAASGQGPETSPGVEGTAAQGSITPESSSSFNWGMFPDIPEDQRGVLEPHLKKTQAHVTKLEQQLSPFKDILSSEEGVQGLQGLIAFDQAFNEDPKGVWESLTASMIEAGTLDPGVLQSLVDQGDEGEDDAEGEINPEIADLKQRLDDRDEADNQQKQKFQEQVSQELLNRQITSISAKLGEAGLDITDENREALNESIVAHIIAAKGNPEKALGSMMALIQGSRKALEQSKEHRDPSMPRGVPPTGKPQRQARNGFDQASQGARQFLDRQARSEVS